MACAARVLAVMPPAFIVLGASSALGEFGVAGPGFAVGLAIEIECYGGTDEGLEGWFVEVQGAWSGRGWRGRVFKLHRFSGHARQQRGLLATALSELSQEEVESGVWCVMGQRWWGPYRLSGVTFEISANSRWLSISGCWWRSRTWLPRVVRTRSQVRTGFGAESRWRQEHRTTQRKWKQSRRHR